MASVCAVFGSSFEEPHDMEYVCTMLGNGFEVQSGKVLDGRVKDAMWQSASALVVAIDQANLKPDTISYSSAISSHVMDGPGCNAQCFCVNGTAECTVLASTSRRLQVSGRRLQAP